MIRIRRHLLSAGVLAVLCSIPAHAQLTAGSVVGTVEDPSGAAIAGAGVAIKNSATGVAGNTVTNGSGIFGFPTLPVGTYTFEATKNGFQTATGTFQIALNVQTSLCHPSGQRHKREGRSHEPGAFGRNYEYPNYEHIFRESGE